MGRDDVRQLIEQLRADVPGAVAAVTPMLAGMFGSPESRAASVSGGPADEAVLADPVLAGRLNGMLDEALRQGTIGLGIDLVAGSVIPADFDPAAVTAPVALFYGAAEVIVPPEHGRWWAERLPAATLHEVPGAGHLLPLTAWADILAALS